MAKPDYNNVFVPGTGGKLRVLDPVSEIIPGLFQGIRPPSYIGYDLVVSCEQFLAKGPMEGYEGMVIHIPMVDDDQFEIPAQAIWDTVSAMENRTGAEYGDSARILVHCSGGLNRSSLVTCSYLMSQGYSRLDAVTVLRAKRDPFCLCNKAFERWVLGEQLPTAETSTFRITDLEEDGPVLGSCSHGVDLDKEFCPQGCRV